MSGGEGAGIVVQIILVALVVKGQAAGVIM